MTPIAAPSPVQPSAKPANGDSASTPGDAQFGDTLKQTRPDPNHRDVAKPAAQNANSDKHQTTTAGDQHDKANKPSDTDSDTTPTSPSAIAALVPALVRQPLAASGKPGGKPAPPTTAAIAAATAGKQTAQPLKLPGINAAQQKPPTAAASTLDTQPTDPQAVLAAATQAQPGASSSSPSPGDGKQKLEPAPQSLLNLSANLVGTQPPTASQPMPPLPHALTMQAAPGAPRFAQETAQHVVWLTGQTIKQAQIQLNPRQLGPIHVEVTTHHDRVDVSFAVQHPQTVHALQQTLPQLHDMLAQQGLNLGHASVGQQAPNQQQTAHHSRGTNARSMQANDVELVSPLQTPRTVASGRVDDFA